MSRITPSPHKFGSARWHGLRVGLLGGSFNPAHAGHLHIARQAILRFNLHAVWWMVSPGNPLKTKNPRGDMAERLADVRALIKDQPKMTATDIEAHLNTRYTFDTVRQLKTRFPRTKFVWIAGMDNAVHFDKWDQWDDLLAEIPFAFFDRPPASNKLKGNGPRGRKGRKQCFKSTKHTLKRSDKGVFWMLRGRAINLSSTEIRQKRAQKRTR